MKIHRLISTTVAAVIMSGIAATALAAPDLTINIGANAVLFRENASISVWVPGSGERWVSALHLSADEITTHQDDLPAENTVVAESGSIAVELLPNGQWQVSSGPDAKGKVNVTIFDAGFAYVREYSWSVYGDPQ